MKALVVYDSQWGDTKRIARAAEWARHLGAGAPPGCAGQVRPTAHAVTAPRAAPGETMRAL